MINKPPTDYDIRREKYASDPLCDYIEHFKTGELIWLSPDETDERRRSISGYIAKVRHYEAIGSDHMDGRREDVNFDPENDPADWS